MPTLETDRLILRSFRNKDVDAMVRLFANADFMRFSLGVFTERKQTVAFIEKVMGWDRRRHPVAICRRPSRQGHDHRLLRFLLSSGPWH